MSSNKLIQKIEKIYNFSCLRLIPLRESSDNKVFIIETSKNLNYILRISKRDVGDDVLFELNWIESLKKKGLPVTSIIKTKDGQLFFYYERLTAVVFKFVDGYSVKIDRKDKPDFDHVRKAAELLANLHNISEKLNLDYPRKRTILSELKRVLARKDKFKHFINGGKQFVDEVTKNIEWAQRDNYQDTFIINDFRPGNIIFKDGEIAALIDFDWSCMGPSIKDLALGIVEWSFPDGSEKPWKDILKLFLDSYNKESRRKYTESDYLYKWICFSCLSDTTTYLCDLADNEIYKNVSSSYMYKKYLYFYSKIKHL